MFKYCHHNNNTPTIPIDDHHKTNETFIHIDQSSPTCVSKNE